VVGPEHIWSFSFVDDVARAHVAAAAHPQPAREYTVGGVNAPQGSIYAFVHERRGRAIPRRLPYAIATAGAVGCELWTAVTGRPPLLTRGVVDIFRHDWPLDSSDAERDLALRGTALTDGLERTLAALP
jgi:nucleoside-diphosphate-sugar epimerase